ncbi:hypothetical protein C9J01_10610 [Photobacterium rosenbergii]|uniref:Uncharacterized protein n=1 Tax=Photobacterium rosenbergii TaxID=294936 RepID=A0A2T3NFF1_9GAMM|nr:hypothetical protein C9J01_10610 [Photobacterium rosenbergii]
MAIHAMDIFKIRLITSKIVFDFRSRVSSMIFSASNASFSSTGLPQQVQLYWVLFIWLVVTFNINNCNHNG